MALTQDRNTPEIAPNLSVIRELPVAAGEKIYAGALVALNSSGYVVKGQASTTLTALGRAEEAVDNSAGAAGDVTVRVRTGIFRYENSATAQITRADIGKTCYIEDDETVSQTDQSGTLSPAGKVFDVDDEGVWVKFEI